MTRPSVRLSIWPSVYLLVCPCIRLSICPPVHVSLSPSVRLFVCLSACLSACPSVRLSVCPFVRLSVCLCMSVCAATESRTSTSRQARGHLRPLGLLGFAGSSVHVSDEGHTDRRLETLSDADRSNRGETL